jgi:shikimate kinase
VPARHVVLVGLMGVGKTTVGRRLARELEVPFVDTDEAVELHAGTTVKRLFASEGEAGFRKLEREVVAGLLARPAPLVLAAGGGAVLDEGTRVELAELAFVVWLRATPAFLAARVDPTHRPLLADGADGALQKLASERAAVYAAVADAVVDVEPFHDREEPPKRALAHHIADLARAAGVPS